MKNLPEIWKYAESLKKNKNIGGIIRIFITRSRNWVGILRDGAIFALAIDNFSIPLNQVFLFSIVFMVFLGLMGLELKNIIPQEYDWVFSRTPFFKTMNQRSIDTEKLVKRIEAKVSGNNYED